MGLLAMDCEIVMVRSSIGAGHLASVPDKMSKFAPSARHLGGKDAIGL